MNKSRSVESDAPFMERPKSLYRVADLYRGFDPAQVGSWSTCWDHRVFKWFIDTSTSKPRDLSFEEMLSARTHDTSLEFLISAFLRGDGRPVVGVMGGHDEKRGGDVYRQIASIARYLTRNGRLILTGGGPGLMEAANLGAFLAPYADDELDKAIVVLAQAEDFSSHEWLSTATSVRARLLGRWSSEEKPESRSVGIPTWLYGHEPPNLFATHSAKLFFNSLREDGLVTLADGGIVFGVGNAGTVQELFQDVTQNYYRSSAVAATPIVLHGVNYWTRDSDDLPTPDSSGKITDKRKPLWPLLRQLAIEKEFLDAILLSDDIDEIVTHLLGVVDDSEEDKRRNLAWRSHW